MKERSFVLKFPILDTQKEATYEELHFDDVNNA